MTVVLTLVMHHYANLCAATTYRYRQRHTCQSTHRGRPSATQYSAGSVPLRLMCTSQRNLRVRSVTCPRQHKVVFTPATASQRYWSAAQTQPRRIRLDAQRLHGALIHQRAGHNLIIDKVAGKKPGVRFYIQFTDN